MNDLFFEDHTRELFRSSFHDSLPEQLSVYFLLGQTKYHNEGKAVQERSSREFRQSLSSSDQVRGQETSPVPKGVLVGYNGM